MRNLASELDTLTVAALDPHQRIAELENENAILRRLLARAADRAAMDQITLLALR